MIKIQVYETDAEQLHVIADENGIEVADVVSMMVDHMLHRYKGKEMAKRVQCKPHQVGRPTTRKEDIPKSFVDGYLLYKEGSINVSQLSRLACVSRPTAYKYIRLLDAE